MTIEPTLKANEFKVVEWDATFLFTTPKPLTIPDAKIAIDKHIEKQFEIFIAQRIKNKHFDIL
jgi:hypothetical protein